MAVLVSHSGSTTDLACYNYKCLKLYITFLNKFQNVHVNELDPIEIAFKNVFGVQTR